MNSLINFGLPDSQWRDAAGTAPPIHPNKSDSVGRIVRILEGRSAMTRDEIARRLHENPDTVRRWLKIGVEQRRLIVKQRRAGPNPALYTLPEYDNG